MTRAAVVTSLVLAAALAISCQRETREESRQTRLDTFRGALPSEVRTSFDTISNEEDCTAVGLMLTEALEEDPSMAMTVDSIMHAELIDTFTDEEVVYFFWYYFAHAIETGTVRGP